jgi:ABC-type polysaccharide/polyol phosphate export permease
MATELWTYRGVVRNLAVRELKLRYKRSLLGWLWSLINPAAILGIYTLVFGGFLRVEAPPAHNPTLHSFAIFLFTGFIVWDFFSVVVRASMGWLMEAGPLLNKVYFPGELPVMAGAMSVTVQTGTEAVILLLVLALVGNLGPTALFLPLILALLFLFTIGVAMMVSLSHVYFRDVAHVVHISTTLLFYATPIVYPFSIVPERLGSGFPIKSVLALNPLTQFVDITRTVLYELRVPSLRQLIGLGAVSAVSFLGGWAVFRRYGRHLSEDM